MDHPQHKPHHAVRKSTSAAVLALALGLTAGVAPAAPAESPPTHSAIVTPYVVDYFRAHGELPPDFSLAQTASATGHVQGVNIPVGNCNDSGQGSLRAAVDFAADGDTIDMSGLSCNHIALTHSIVIGQDNLTLKGHRVFVQVGGSSYFRPVPEIDAQGIGRALYFNGSGWLTLKELQVAGGDGGSNNRYGGCILAYAGNLSLDNTWVHDCIGYELGGAIYGKGDVSLSNGSGVYDNTVVDGSSSKIAGGGIWAEGNVRMYSSSYIRDNTVTGTGLVMGGGIYAKTGVLLQDHATMRGNKLESTGPQSPYGSQVAGAGIYSLGAVVISSSQVIDNWAPEGTSSNGAGIHANGTILAGDCQIVGNYFYPGGSNQHSTGGGVYANGSVYMNDCLIYDNQASSAGGINLQGSSASSVTNSEISYNHATRSGGGAISNRGGKLTISKSTIDNNDQYSNAALSLLNLGSGPVLIEQSTISGNNTLQDANGGAGIFAKGTSLTVKNSTIYANTAFEHTNAPDRRGAGISLDDGATLVLESSIVANNLHKTANTENRSDIGYAEGADTGTITTTDNNQTNFVAWNDAGSLPNRIGFGSDPGIGPLHDNGGPTSTHLPEAGSPVILSGSANGYTTDQRGTGFQRTDYWGGGCADLGSVQRDGDIIFRNGFELKFIPLC